MVFSQVLTFYRSDLAKIRKNEKLFEDELDVEDIKFPVKIKDIHKIEINNSIGISVFVYESKGKYSLYVSRNTSKEHVNPRKYYILVKDFETFIYDGHTLHHGWNHFVIIVYKPYSAWTFSGLLPYVGKAPPPPPPS